MNICPCCSETLLRHARSNRIYWFCTHCWQEMDDPSSVRAEIENSHSLMEFSDLLSLVNFKSLAVLRS